jgi:hypothetical protein
MAFKYKFIKLDYNNPPTLIIKVFKDGKYVYRYSDYMGTPYNQIVDRAREYLKGKYGEEANTLQPDSTINVLATSGDPEFFEESQKLPKPNTDQQTTLQPSKDQKNPQTTTIQQQSNVIPPKIEEKKLEPTEGKTVAKGFGAIVSNINKGINKVRVAVNNFYYGKTNISDKKKLSNPLDYGLINLLNALASVDICAVFSFAANKLPGTKPFNPKTDKEKAKTTLGKTKYQIQYAAYEIQTIIDGYYLSYGDLKSPVAKTQLGGLVSSLSQFLEVLLSPTGDNPFQNPELRTAFPSISIFDNYLQNASKFLSLNQDVSSLNPTEVDKVISYIDKTRQVCISIQSLNNPANLIGFADTFLGANIGKQLQQLDKILDIKQISKVLKSIIDTCKKLQNVCNQLLSFINSAKLIIKIATVLIQIFKIIAKFFIALPAPNIFSTTGITTAMANAHSKVTDTADFFLKRLSEINSVLENIYYLAQDITIKIGNIIDVINLVKGNLQSCNSDDNSLDIDPDIIAELSSVADNLKTTKESLDSFISTYENNKKKTNNTFGNYTIVILTEQLVDEGISLKRRYGIALDKNGIEIVKSTLTFASDDQVIIQEVKLLLLSKNLVSPSINSSIAQNITISDPTELAILEESLNFLDDPTIDINTVDDTVFESDLDDPENDDEEAEDSLNLNAFVSKLKGGRRLRRRMRKMMAKQKLELVASLNKADPGGKFANKTLKQQKKSAINDAIKAEKELITIYKEDIKKYEILIIANPTSIIVYKILIKKKKEKIKEIEDKIKNLEKQLK